MMNVIERATGVEYMAKAIEGGFEVYTLKGEFLKKVKESTFKRYFKPSKSTQKTEKEVKPEAKSKSKKDEPQPEKKEAKKESQPEEPKAKKASAKKPEEATVHEELSPEKREKMIEKIKKILKLAEDNPSMEEGLSAALQAQKLMAKYNIHEDEVTLEEIKDDICSVFSTQKHNSHLLNWRKQLAAIVARNFRCKTYLQNKDVVFRGYRNDAEIALQVYLSLYTIGNKLGSKAYAEQKEETGSGKGAFNSFVMGFLTGVNEGLSTQCTALMVIVPKEVEEEFSQFSASFKVVKRKAQGIDNYELFQKGRTEGKAAVKSRAIEAKGKGGKK